MKFLETWVESPLAGAIGWTLLHTLWEGAILSALLASMLLVVRSPRARYAAACIAMVIMLGGVGLTFVYVMPEGVHGLRTVGTPAFPAWKVPNDIDAPSPLSHQLAVIVPWLAPLWIVGVWIFCSVNVVGWISVCRLRRRGVCCAPAHWQKELVRLSAELRLSRPILLMESCLVDVPMVLGHFRPFILMPIGLLAGLPPEQIEAILLHELAHIRRCDYLVNVLQRLAEGLLFYHPAVWWIARVIRDEREHCCDDVVVALSDNAHQYAVALTALEQNRWPGRKPAVAATGGSLVKRIRRLLYPNVPNGAWTPMLAVILLIATVAVALAVWRSEPLQQTFAAAQPQTDHAEISPYDKWLNQDVVYIITDEERAAFLRLTTDEERDKFTEQFWERRDPTPGTVENEFKAEHFRRIAYANEHFRTASGRPGWQTDRGHMYIVYGPPDEIDSHPSGSINMPPYEFWGYRHIEGIGDDLSVTFIDKSGKGDYHLAPGKAVR